MDSKNLGFSICLIILSFYGLKKPRAFNLLQASLFYGLKKLFTNHLKKKENPLFKYLT